MDSSHPRIRVSFCLTEALDEDAIASDAALLSEDERARGSRLVFSADRRDFIAAHALLRRALSAERPRDPAAWRFETGPHGKPSIEAADRGDPPLAFNLSHTRGLVACAVASGCEVGIDAERTDRAGSRDALAARFFHPSEIAHLRTQAEPARRTGFIELWTLKEAYLKATGAGLTIRLRDCVFEFGDDRAPRLAAAPDSGPRRWNFGVYAVGADRYRIAVAHDGEGTIEPPSVERSLT